MWSYLHLYSSVMYKNKWKSDLCANSKVFLYEHFYLFHCHCLFVSCLFCFYCFALVSVLFACVYVNFSLLTAYRGGKFCFSFSSKYWKTLSFSIVWYCLLFVIFVVAGGGGRVVSSIVCFVFNGSLCVSSLLIFLLLVFTIFYFLTSP